MNPYILLIILLCMMVIGHYIIAQAEKPEKEKRKQKFKEFEENYYKEHNVNESDVYLFDSCKSKILIPPLVVQTFIENAMKHGLEPKIEGGFLLLDVKEKAKNCIIRIFDSGCGMTKEQVKRVKEPFYRVDKARSREAGRTGLGLAICSQIVEYHNARMNIQSEPDKGTIITVLFPKKFTV